VELRAGSEANRTVAQVLSELRTYWPELAWQTTSQPQPHEANLLSLNITMARTKLGWQPVWPLGEALKATAEWYCKYFSTGRADSGTQLFAFVDSARATNNQWSRA
jgi:CDP-glucose 4,6-dehydratase